MADLQVQKREILGRQVNSLRKQGLVPAELYGQGIKNAHLSVSARDFKKIFISAGESTVINLVLDSKKHPVLIHDVSFDYLSGDPIAVDFYQVRMDKKIELKIPLEFVGISQAVKEKGGILIKVLHEIEIEALPADIPHSFIVDISKLSDIGQSIHVKDLNIPKGVEIDDMEAVVATVSAKVTEEEELAMQQETSGKVEEVKIETEEKKTEREAEKAAVSSETTSAPESKPSK
jgi:large subunit ribosomal protein L25